MTYDPVKIGRKFSMAREASGWGQMKLAIKLGYANNSQLSEFENGKGMLPMDKLYEAANIMGLPPWILINDKEYSSEQLRLINLFFRKVIECDNFKFADTIKHLLDS